MMEQFNTACTSWFINNYVKIRTPQDYNITKNRMSDQLF